MPVTPPPSEILAHLEVICSSATFARSEQGKTLLRYLVNAAVRNAEPGCFKGMIIGIEVFGLPTTHDPQRQSTVRVAIAALREILAKYYAADGRNEPIRVFIPDRSYRPEIAYDARIAALALDKTSGMFVANAKSLMNQRTLPGFREAERYIERALERNPEHPRLLSLLAMSQAASALYGVHPRSAFEAARALIERARQCGYEPWELPLVDAWITMNLNFDWSRANELFERAIQLNATEARYHTWYTAFLASQLRWPEFLSLVEAAATGPSFDSPYARGRLAFAQLVAGQMEAAADTLRQTVELFPQIHYTTQLHIGLLREALGDFSGAAQAFEQMSVAAKDTTIALGLQAFALGMAGEKTTAHRLYEELRARKQSNESFIPATQLGYACIGIGKFDLATHWISEGYLNECDPMSSWAGILPGLRHLRGEREFNRLVTRRLNLRFREDSPTKP